MRQIVGISADLHSGHKLGLLNPDTTLWQEGPNKEPVPYKPNPTETQKITWAEYTTNMRLIQGLAGADELIVFNDGDVTWGNKHPEGSLTTRMADQVLMAYDCLLPWLQYKNTQHMRLVSGTGAHDYGESSSDLLVAALLRTKTEKDVQVVGHSLLSVGGVEMDVAHHGPPPSSRNWLQGNSARYYLRDVMERAIHQWQDPPRLVIRGHYHCFIHETLTIKGYKNWTSDLIVLPSYCGFTDFARQATRSASRIEFGSIAAEITDGQLTNLVPFVKSFDMRRRESL